MIRLSIYDFDKTIYNGDTGVQVLIKIFKKYPKTFRYIPKMIWSLLRYLFKKDTTLTFKQNIFQVIEYFDKTEWDHFIEMFWIEQEKSFFPLVIKQLQQDHKEGYTIGIISASPEIMLTPILHRLKADFLIGTIFNTKDGKISSQIIGKNCKNYEKVSRLNKYMEIHYPDQPYIIEKMYSDSLHDLPLFQEARQQITVEKNGIMRSGLPQKNNNL